MKNIKLFLGATLLFTSILFGMTAALMPAFLSSDRAKDILVNKVNSSSSGKLALDDCAIGWTEGLQCSGISYKNKDYQVDAARLTGTRGLFALFMAPGNLGTVTVDDPVVVITRLEEQPGNGGETGDTAAVQSDSVTSSEAENRSREEAKPEDAADQPATWFWHKMSGKLLLNRAAVQLRQGDREPQTVLKTAS